MAEQAEKAGVALLIVSHPLQHGPEGWLFFQMRGALAEYERAKILERMKRGLWDGFKRAIPGAAQGLRLTPPEAHVSVHRGSAALGAMWTCHDRHLQGQGQRPVLHLH